MLERLTILTDSEVGETSCFILLVYISFGAEELVCLAVSRHEPSRGKRQARLL